MHSGDESKQEIGKKRHFYHGTGTLVEDVATNIDLCGFLDVHVRPACHM